MKIVAFNALALSLLSTSAYAQYEQQSQYQTPNYTTPSPGQQTQYQQPQSQYMPQTQPQQGSYGPPPSYYPSYYPPVYPGGYLPPGPVFPGEDEANKIYEQNQHPPR